MAKAPAGTGRRGAKPRRRGAPPLHPGVAQLRALAHPLRLRLVELFAEAPRTTKQVADLLGEPPTRLYHHVNALEQAGLLRLRETRANRGAVEKWYEASATMWSTGAGPTARRAGSKAAKAAKASSASSTTGLALTLLDQARHELTASLRALPSSSPAAAADDAPLLVRLVAVGAAKRDEVRRRVLALLHELREAAGDAPDAGRRTHDAAAAERWALTLAFAPVTSPRGVAKRASDSATKSATKTKRAGRQ